MDFDVMLGKVRKKVAKMPFERRRALLRASSRLLKRDLFEGVEPLIEKNFDVLESKFFKAYQVSDVYLSITEKIMDYCREEFPDADVVMLGRDAWPFYVSWRMMDGSDLPKPKLVHVSRYMMTSRDPFGQKVYTGILKYLYDKGLEDDDIELTDNPYYVKVDIRYSAFGTYLKAMGLGSNPILLFDVGYRGTVITFVQRTIAEILDVHTDTVMLFSINRYVPSLFESHITAEDFGSVPRFVDLHEHGEYEELSLLIERWPHPIDPVERYAYDEYGRPYIVEHFVQEKDKLSAHLFYFALKERASDRYGSNSNEEGVLEHDDEPLPFFYP